MSSAPADAERAELLDLERQLIAEAENLAVLLVYDRPTRVEERPDLERTYFEQRCISDLQLTEMVEAFQSVGVYVQVFEGEKPFLAALANGEIEAIKRKTKVVYDGIEGGITLGGFEPGRNALLPAVADAYDLVCANANAYARALGRHKFHYLTLLRTLGVAVPPAWQYWPASGWAAGRTPPPGTKVIVKSTYEAWSVGVTQNSIFVVDDDCEERAGGLAEAIGQPVTVQTFIAGTEICVPLLSHPDHLLTPPMEAIVTRSPDSPDAVMTIDDTLREDGLNHRRAAIRPAVHEALRRATGEAADILGLGSFARIDFRVDSEDHVWLIDIGTSPGVGRRSSAYKSSAQLGLGYPEFLRVIVAAALASRGLLRSPARTQPQEA